MLANSYHPFFMVTGGQEKIYENLNIIETSMQVSSLEDQQLLQSYLSKTGLIHDKAVSLRLDLILQGHPALLYHGSTANFKSFNQQFARSELNQNFYGDGIFFTPSKDIAYKYARANRNYGIPEEIISELKSLDKRAGELLEDLCKLGFEKGWETTRSHQLLDDINKGAYKFKIDIDLNDINDISEYVVGSKTIELGDDIGNVMAAFSGNTKSIPEHVLRLLKNIGIKQNLPIPKIYTISYKPKKVKVSTKQISGGGYDTVIYIGKGLVDNIPEIQTFQNNVPVFKVEEIETIRI